MGVIKISKCIGVSNDNDYIYLKFEKDTFLVNEYCFLYNPTKEILGFTGEAVDTDKFKIYHSAFELYDLENIDILRDKYFAIDNWSVETDKEQLWKELGSLKDPSEELIKLYIEVLNE